MSHSRLPPRPVSPHHPVFLYFFILLFVFNDPAAPREPARLGAEPAASPLARFLLPSRLRRHPPSRGGGGLCLYPASSGPPGSRAQLLAQPPFSPGPLQPPAPPPPCSVAPRAQARAPLSPPLPAGPAERGETGSFCERFSCLPARSQHPCVPRAPGPGLRRHRGGTALAVKPLARTDRVLPKTFSQGAAAVW